MILVRMNHLELTTESNRTKLSIIRFYNFVSFPCGSGIVEKGFSLTWLLSSNNVWSYSLNATQKMMEVTFSKQWIHFFRSLRWPPTSNMLQELLVATTSGDGVKAHTVCSIGPS